MSLKLITLNIEGNKHFDLVFPFITTYQPDIMCLQEVFAVDLAEFTSRFGGQILFTPMSNMKRVRTRVDTPRGLWGIAIWLRDGLQLASHETLYYAGSHASAHEDNDPGYDSSRVVIVAKIMHQDEEFVIATTHFTWTPDGVADERQWRDFTSLITLLQPYPELVLCGDFNAPRGGEIFSALSEHFIDHLPPDVTSTLDPELHRYKDAFELAVDSIFATPSYLVENVTVRSGVSDHKAIVAQIGRAKSS